MFSGYKPKKFRNNNGCCICGTKSSSSRFTDSKKYEPDFEKCFRIVEKRTGEICNACVLLVKRWRKLPNESDKHWNHVVDARAGTGIKSTQKIKNKLNPVIQKYKSTLKPKHNFISNPSPSLAPDDLSGSDKHNVKSRNVSDSDDSDDYENGKVKFKKIRRTRKKKATNYPPISSYIDLTYWKITKICCGIIFKGLNGEVMVDPHLLKPCKPHHNDKSPEKKISHRSQSLEATNSNSSGSRSSFGEVDFSSVANQSTSYTPPLKNDVEASMILTNDSATELGKFQNSLPYG